MNKEDSVIIFGGRMPLFLSNQKFTSTYFTKQNFFFFQKTKSKNIETKNYEGMMKW